MATFVFFLAWAVYLLREENILPSWGGAIPPCGKSNENMQEELDVAKYPPLNLPPCRLRLRRGSHGMEVWDEWRGRYVSLTPEEWVRQHVLHLLGTVMGYPKELMQVEGSIAVNGMLRRCDIVVHCPVQQQDASLLCPMMIVECKQPHVALTQSVIDQASRYNGTLQVPYFFLTNGMEHLCLRVNAAQQQLEQLLSFPTWEELRSGGNIEVLPEEDGDCCCGHHHSHGEH